MPIVLFLHSHGARINELTRGRWSPLHYAVSHNQVESTRFLLAEKDIEIDTMRARDGPTPLGTAVKSGAVDCIRLLVEAGCSFTLGIAKGTMRSRLTTHPIVLAAKEGQIKVLDYFIGQDRGWGSIDADGVEELIDEAVNCGDKEVFDRLCQKLTISKVHKINYADVIARVIRNGGAMEFVRSLLAMGTCPVHFRRFSDGMAFLHMAAARGNLETVMMLVDLGADVNIRTTEGHTPLWLAIRAKNVEVAEWLARHPDLDPYAVMTKHKIGYARAAQEKGIATVVQIIHGRGA
jgi:ankyrin repeat protein